MKTLGLAAESRIDAMIRAAALRGQELRSANRDTGAFAPTADTSLLRKWEIPATERFYFEQRENRIEFYPAELVEQPGWCHAEGCELKAEKGEAYCAFHEMQYECVEGVDRDSYIPIREAVTGGRVWDGFAQGYFSATGRAKHQPFYIASPAITPRSGPIHRPTEIYRRRVTVFVAVPWMESQKIVELSRRLVDTIPRPRLFREGGGFFRKAEQKHKLIEALLSGLSVRAAATQAGCAKGTAIRFNRWLVAERLEPMNIGAPKCGCGKPATHRGWCKVRFGESVKRQQWQREHNNWKGVAA